MIIRIHDNFVDTLCSNVYTSSDNFILEAKLRCDESLQFISFFVCFFCIFIVIMIFVSEFHRIMLMPFDFMSVPFIRFVFLIFITEEILLKLVIVLIQLSLSYFLLYLKVLQILLCYRFKFLIPFSFSLFSR